MPPWIVVKLNFSLSDNFGGLTRPCGRRHEQPGQETRSRIGAERRRRTGIVIVAAGKPQKTLPEGGAEVELPGKHGPQALRVPDHTPFTGRLGSGHAANAVPIYSGDRDSRRVDAPATR
jgi:hypothetical protein